MTQLLLSYSPEGGHLRCFQLSSIINSTNSSIKTCPLLASVQGPALTHDLKLSVLFTAVSGAQRVTDDQYRACDGSGYPETEVFHFYVAFSF